MARRFLAVLALAFVALTSDASAHAVLTRATPADGARLARPPHELRLEFSEPLAPRFRVVRLLDARGRVVAGTRVRAGGSRGVNVSLPRLSRGAYQVTWEVLAA
ncbi:MAG TPA: copper resistance CopC family protein, partial [Solirubrobacter sp.]